LAGRRSWTACSKASRTKPACAEVLPFPPPAVQLVRVNAVPPRHHAGHGIRRQALRDDPRLFLRAPASTPFRASQNFGTRAGLLSNGQITWVMIHAKPPLLGGNSARCRQTDQCACCVSLTFNRSITILPKLMDGKGGTFSYPLIFHLMISIV
jgi:hypothetical protein